MDIRYEDARMIAADDFCSVLRRSTLGERRPVDDRDRIRAMLEHADLLVTAWSGETLVGVARSVTDFAFCCYLSDLAVDVAWQGRGVGTELIRRTQARLHPEAKLILLSAPKAAGYYPKVGFQAHSSAWIVGARAALGAGGGAA